MQNTRKRKLISVFICFLTVIFVTSTLTYDVHAAPKLNYTSRTIERDSSFTLSISGTSKTVKWSTSDSKIASIKKVSNKKYKVIGKKVGKATISAKVNGKTYKCSVKVTKKRSEDQKYTIQLKNGKTTTVVGHFEDKYAKDVISQLNKYRDSKNRKTLKQNSTLMKAADTRAIESSYKFSHTRPNGKPWNSISKLMNGENIAMGYTTPSDVMKGWKNSSGHNKNMLSKDFTKIGVSCFAKRGEKKSDGTYRYTYYWVQNFGR